MDKGYLLFAIDTEEVRYSDLAYACGLSIKLTQPDNYNNISVVTNCPERLNYNIFDKVIEYHGPLGMDSRSRSLDYTPYAETVLLDSDMLILKDISHHWNIMSSRDLFISSYAQTYNGKRIRYGYYRKLFENNRLPDIYSAWTYFKKDSNIAKDFFNTVKLITDYPQTFINNLDKKILNDTLPTDEAFAIALGILDIENIATCNDWEFPAIIHMKGMAQGWKEEVIDWTERLRFTLDQTGQAKLGVWQQTEILHYVNKDLITPAVIKMLENACSL